MAVNFLDKVEINFDKSNMAVELDKAEINLDKSNIEIDLDKSKVVVG